MSRILAGLAAVFVSVLLPVAAPAASPRTGGEAVNDWSHDEFQFTFGFDNPVTPPGRKSSAHSTVYVYVPPGAKKIRALLLLQQNVVEQKISVDPAIRRVCDANAVAIAWCSPGFDLVFTENAAKLHELVQAQFRRFGATVGYPELGDVPLIAFGHSNTTAYALNGAEARPDRVLAVFDTHGWNGANAALNRYHGPVLVFIGSYWEQKQQGLGNGTNKGITALTEVQKRLHRGWVPLSLIEEYGSGHFDYGDPVIRFFGLYLDKAIQARLAPDGTLRDLNPDDGYVAGVTEFPTAPIPIKRYADASPDERAAWPWYFDRETAEAAVKLMEGNGSWHRGPQLIGFKKGDGSVAPFSKAGPVSPVPYQILPGTNEIRMWPTLLPTFPTGFKEAGQPTAPCSDPTVAIEWDCGPYLFQDADGTYRVKLNRNGFGGYLVARNLGDANARPAVQGARFVLSGDLGDRPHGTGNGPDGAPQWWPVGSAPVRNPGAQKCGARLQLPQGGSPKEYLGYFVDYGPARVVGNELEILPLPANTAGPLPVKLTAYRLGQTILGMSSVTFEVSR